MFQIPFVLAGKYTEFPARISTASPPSGVNIARPARKWHTSACRTCLLHIPGEHSHTPTSIFFSLSVSASQHFNRATGSPIGAATAPASGNSRLVASRITIGGIRSLPVLIFFIPSQDHASPHDSVA